MANLPSHKTLDTWGIKYYEVHSEREPCVSGSFQLPGLGTSIGMYHFENIAACRSIRGLESTTLKKYTCQARFYRGMQNIFSLLLVSFILAVLLSGHIIIIFTFSKIHQTTDQSGHCF
ncbi:hypothetical protein CEXT_812771 [Caerostris extrusa]|uniref:Uncharacterized protein n=1 Tax=Caerostris extrusa TaxID=172846 RepID=A0AAV4NJ20_CAEEX|nr:hypothetical protein CEXT_812771 [Caerostris extrusa]